MFENKFIKYNEITEWVISRWPRAVEDIELIKIYRSNDWGVTARFGVIEKCSDRKEIIVKVGFLPIFKTSVDIYTLLNKLSSGRVPNMLIGEFKEGKAWLVFEPFQGDAIEAVNKIDSLKDIAASAAKIQFETSRVLGDGENLPVIKINDIPRLFDGLLNKYLEKWETDGRTIAEQLEISYDSYKSLFKYESLSVLREKIVKFSNELEDKGLPYSIDHLDLHSGNAARLNNGEIVVYDWEEAVISCPFFSTDKLLDEAGELDKEIETHRNYLWSENQTAVKEAYLLEIPWLEPLERSRAFDMAMCLAPIKYAYQSTFFIDQVGWQESGAALIAQSIIKAHERCSIINR